MNDATKDTDTPIKYANASHFYDMLTIVRNQYLDKQKLSVNAGKQYLKEALATISISVEIDQIQVDANHCPYIPIEVMGGDDVIRIVYLILKPHRRDGDGHTQWSVNSKSSDWNSPHSEWDMSWAIMVNGHEVIISKDNLEATFQQLNNALYNTKQNNSNLYGVG